MHKMRLVDITKCVACKGCQVACKQWNQLPAQQTVFTGSYENPADLDFNTWSRVQFNEHEEGGGIKWYFTFTSCMHCDEPACAPVCPVKAIAVTELGAVVVDQETCIGCGICRTACPFDIPRIDAGKMAKCTFCFDRISNNLSTACSRTCAPGAISFGNESDIIAKAEARVSALGGNAQIYGKDEVGGTNCIFVLPDSPEKCGLPANPEVGLSAYFWKSALKPVRALAAVGITIGFMNNFIKQKAAQMEKEKMQVE